MIRQWVHHLLTHAREHAHAHEIPPAVGMCMPMRIRLRARPSIDTVDLCRPHNFVLLIHAATCAHEDFLSIEGREIVRQLADAKIVVIVRLAEEHLPRSVVADQVASIA